MGIWMCPGDIIESVVSLDLRVGGKFTINMRNPRGDDIHSGEYVEVTPPYRLAFTWSSQGTQGRRTLVRLDFREHGDDECELTLVHEELPEVAIEPHSLGWKAHLRMLINHLAARR